MTEWTLHSLDERTYLCVAPKAPLWRRILEAKRTPQELDRVALERLLFALALRQPRWTGEKMQYERIAIIMDNRLTPGIVATLSTADNAGAAPLKSGSPETFIPCCIHLYVARHAKGKLRSCVTHAEVMRPTLITPQISFHEVIGSPPPELTPCPPSIKKEFMRDDFAGWGIGL